MNYYLIDVNLPKFFSFFNKENFSFVEDIDLQLSDTKIWEYAIQNNMIIVTKDTDFYDRYLISEQKPKIIFLQLGNVSLSELYLYFKQNWKIIEREIAKGSLVIAKPTHIQRFE